MNESRNQSQKADAPAEVRQEQYRDFYINELSDGWFHIVKNGVELGSSISRRLAREFIDEYLLNEDIKGMEVA